MIEQSKPETKLMSAIFCCVWAADYSPFSDEDLHDSIDGVSLKSALLATIDTLARCKKSSTHNLRVRRVIAARFGLDDGQRKTLKEVGEEFDVTSERIWQIQARGLRQLRHPRRSQKLRRYIKETAATRK